MSLHEPEKLKAPPANDFSRQNGDSGAKAAEADSRGGEITPQAVVEVDGEELGNEDGSAGSEVSPSVEQTDQNG